MLLKLVYVPYILASFLLAQLFQFIGIMTKVSNKGGIKRNIFLAPEGGYEPVGDELEPVCDLNNTPLPDDFPDGVYVRNGPNPQFRPWGDYHFFEGDGMLHAATVKKGKVRYMNRYVRTQKYETEKLAEEPILWGVIYSANPFVMLFQYYQTWAKAIPRIPDGNASNTNVVYYAGKLLSLFEGGLPYEVKLGSMETATPGVHYNFEGQWKFNSFTAHPKIDPETGEMISFGYNVNTKPLLHYGIITPENGGKVVHQVTFDSDSDDLIKLIEKPTLMHDIQITKNYTIMMIFPYFFDKKLVVSKNLRLPFELDKNSHSIFAVIPRYYKKTDRILVFKASPCYVFHTINAYEDTENNCIVIHGCKNPSLQLDIGLFKNIDEFKLKNKDRQFVSQWTLNLKEGSVTEEDIEFTFVDENKKGLVYCDFPTIPQHLVTKKHRYAYAMSTDETFWESRKVYKLDFEERKVFTMEYPPKRLIGEYSVVLKREKDDDESGSPRAEDDVYLVSFTSDVKTKQSFFEVVDATNMKDICSIQLPRRIPRGFHGTWITTEEKHELQTEGSSKQ